MRVVVEGSSTQNQLSQYCWPRYVASESEYSAEILLNSPVINNLHTLDVSMNILSSEMVDKLSQLDCNVIAQPQDRDYYNQGYGGSRYSSLYE